MIGSRGALGILSQLTFKLKPIPERFIIQRWKFSEPAAVAISLERLNTSVTRPVVIDLETCGQSSWSLFVGVEGPSDVCEWQIERLHEEISDASEKKIDEHLKLSDLPVDSSPFDLGEVSFHYGYTFHRAGPNTTDQTRKIMTIIYMDKDMRLAEPKNQNQEIPSIAINTLFSSRANLTMFQVSCQALKLILRLGSAASVMGTWRLVKYPMEDTATRTKARMVCRSDSKSTVSTPIIKPTIIAI